LKNLATDGTPMSTDKEKDQYELSSFIGANRCPNGG